MPDFYPIQCITNEKDLDEAIKILNEFKLDNNTKLDNKKKIVIIVKKIIHQTLIFVGIVKK